METSAPLINTETTTKTNTVKVRLETSGDQDLNLEN